MPSFTGIIQKYSGKGEKTGWTYVDIPDDMTGKLKLKSKQLFRIRGFMDEVSFEKLAVYPVGDGQYIIALNADIRKQLRKKEGAVVQVKFEIDDSEAQTSPELISCLEDDARAKKQFYSMPKSHQNYFHRYIFSAKGQATKAGRIVNVINAMYQKQNFGEMIRSLKK